MCVCQIFSNPNFTLFNSDSKIQKSKCEYCQCDCQNTSCLKYLKKIDDKCICNDLKLNGWLLDRKNDYIFLIDVYDTYQTGCELPFRISDIENGNLQKEFNKSGNLNIPTITCTLINETIPNVDTEHIKYKEQNESVEYKIDFDTFISIINFEDSISSYFKWKEL